MPQPSGAQYVFGDFLLDIDRHLLLRAGEPVRLTPKAFELLHVLVESQNRLLSKDDLIKALWPDTFVEDANLSFNIHQVRKAIGDDGDGQQLIETIPKKGYRFRAVVQVLQSAESATADAGAQSPSTQRVATVRPAGRRWIIAAVIALGALASVAYVAKRILPEASRTKTANDAGRAVLKRRTTVVVLDMQNATGRRPDEWLSTALSEMLFTELSVGDAVRLIPRDAAAQMERELGLVKRDTLSSDTLRRVRANANADLVVGGSFTLLGQTPHRPIRLDVRVQDAKTGNVLASIAETGVESSLFALVSDAGARLRERLQAGNVSGVDAQSLEASLPSSQTALQAYAEGLAKLRRLDALAARESFAKAVAAEPSFALSHAALADAWAVLGYDDKATAEAKQAFDLSASLTQPQRLLVEARYRRRASEWDLALEIYRRLQKFFPDDPEYVLQASEVQTSAGKPRDALETVQAFRKSVGGDDARLDLAKAIAYHQLGDLNAEMNAVREAVREAVAHRAASILAAARRQEGVVQNSQGRPDEAVAAAKAAGDAFAAVGNEAGYAWTLLDTANYLRAKAGDTLNERRAIYEKALVIYRRIGDKKGESNALNSIGGVLEDKGDLVGAQRSYEASLALRRLIDNRLGIGDSLNNLGDILEVKGELESAERMYESALAVYRQIDARENIALAVGEVGEIKRLRGDIIEARSLLEQSAKEWRSMGNRSIYAADVLRALADVLVVQDDLGQARGTYEEAFRMTKDMAKAQSSRVIQMRLAELTLEEGRPGEAARACSELRVALHDRSPLQPEIDALMISALLAEGKVDDAERAFEEARGRLAGGANTVEHVDFSVAGARVHAARRRFTKAVDMLQDAITETKARGCLECQLKATLALAEVEMLAGKSTAGRERLRALVALASNRGFLLIARKAATARRP
jgi:eukaryotic-like serine/threonine-protein kinase